MSSDLFSVLTGQFDHCMEILKTISDDEKAEAVKYRVSQKTGPTLFFSISHFLQHWGIKLRALGKNWVLAHLENVQKLTDRLRDAWDIQQGSIRVSFKSEHFVLINIFVKHLKETFDTLSEDHTKDKTYKKTNKQEIANQTRLTHT